MYRGEGDGEGRGREREREGERERETDRYTLCGVNGNFLRAILAIFC